jgi:hypothetical protein
MRKIIKEGKICEECGNIIEKPVRKIWCDQCGEEIDEIEDEMVLMLDYKQQGVAEFHEFDSWKCVFEFLKSFDEMDKIKSISLPVVILEEQIEDFLELIK